MKAGFFLAFVPLVLAVPAPGATKIAQLRRALGDMTQNDVKNGACKPMTILFARGTTEQGNMGTVAGPPFVKAVGQMAGADNVAVQGIEYPADQACHQINQIKLEVQFDLI